MSVIVAVRKNGNAVIASDSQGSTDGLVSSAEYRRHPKKIHTFGNSLIGVVGESAFQNVFESVFKKYKQEIELRAVAEIFESFRVLHEVLKNEYYVNTASSEEEAFESIQCEVLIVNPHGLFRVQGNGFVSEWSRFGAIGCAEPIALGAMHSLYSRCDDVSVIAQAGVEAACEFDPHCGLPIDCRAITLKPPVGIRGSNGAGRNGECETERRTALAGIHAPPGKAKSAAKGCCVDRRRKPSPLRTDERTLRRLRTRPRVRG